MRASKSALRDVFFFESIIKKSGTVTLSRPGSFEAGLRGSKNKPDISAEVPKPPRHISPNNLLSFSRRHERVLKLTLRFIFTSDFFIVSANKDGSA